jgi:hypothetical protein
MKTPDAPAQKRARGMIRKAVKAVVTVVKAAWLIAQLLEE